MNTISASEIARWIKLLSEAGDALESQPLMVRTEARMLNARAKIKVIRDLMIDATASDVAVEDAA